MESVANVESVENVDRVESVENVEDKEIVENVGYGERGERGDWRMWRVWRMRRVWNSKCGLCKGQVFCADTKQNFVKILLRFKIKHKNGTDFQLVYFKTVIHFCVAPLSSGGGTIDHLAPPVLKYRAA